MRKKTIIFMLLTIIMASCISLKGYAAEVETSASENNEIEVNNAGDGFGTVSIQGYVEDEIREQGYSLYVVIENYDTYERFETYLYLVNDYHNTIKVPAGKYIWSTGTVAGDITSKYPSRMKDYKFDSNKRYHFEVPDGGVYNLGIAFGDNATFDDVIHHDDVPAIIQTEAPTEETTEAITETEPVKETEEVTNPETVPEIKNEKSGISVSTIVWIAVIAVLAIALVVIKIKKRMKK